MPQAGLAAGGMNDKENQILRRKLVPPVGKNALTIRGYSVNLIDGFLVRALGLGAVSLDGCNARHVLASLRDDLT